MKVRWTQNSVRLRITPPELEALQHHGLVREELALGADARWSATILPGGALSRLSLRDGALLLSLSSDDLAVLSEPDAEGVYFEPQEADGLRYYVEKDFPCAHPRASEAQELETKTFDPPDDFESRKASETS